MPTILKFRKYNSADSALLTGASAELTVDTDKQTIRVHDNATAGGTIIATENYVDATDATIRADIAAEFNDYSTTVQVDAKDSTILGDAQLYADTNIASALTNYNTITEIDAKDTAILTSANSYTDTRETQIRNDWAFDLTSYDVSTTIDSKISTALTSYDVSTVVDSKISTAVNDLINGAPGALDTINELAAAIGNDADYAGTITNALALKAPLESPALTGTPTTTTPATVDNSSQIANTEFTQAAINAIVQAALPAGIITMWSGSVATIPSGWVLCDGANGTPNMTDRFVVGSGGSKYSSGDTGGADTLNLTIGQLPSHSHTATTGNDGAHTHFTVASDTVLAGAEVDGTNYIADVANIGTSYSYNLGGTATVASVGLTSENGAHSHSFTTDTTGNGDDIDNRPLYFAVAYIMKQYI